MHIRGIIRMFMGKEGKMKKRMKKLLSSLVCLTMVFSLPACGTEKQEETKPGTDAVSMEEADTSTLEGWGEAVKSSLGGTTITALLASHDSTTAMTEMIDEFTEPDGNQCQYKSACERGDENHAAIQFIHKVRDL